VPTQIVPVMQRDCTQLALNWIRANSQLNFVSDVSVIETVREPQSEDIWTADRATLQILRPFIFP